jgi:hypothetical protein
MSVFTPAFGTARCAGALAGIRASIIIVLDLPPPAHRPPPARTRETRTCKLLLQYGRMLEDCLR